MNKLYECNECYHFRSAIGLKDNYLYDLCLQKKEIIDGEDEACDDFEVGGAE